jgi:twitching motility protein PilT
VSNPDLQIPDDEFSFRNVAPCDSEGAMDLEPQGKSELSDSEQESRERRDEQREVDSASRSGPRRRFELVTASSVPEQSSEEQSSEDQAAEQQGAEDQEAEEQPAPPPAALHQTGFSPRHQIEAWLAAMVSDGASDIILRAGGRPSLRVDGNIRFLPGRVPGPGPMKEVLEGILGPRRWEEWNENGSADSAIQLDGLGRFRINAARQMGEPAMVIRRVNECAPDLGSLGLPVEELKALAGRQRGLILVTGVAGSGKSTTLGGMIQHINQTQERHIITLEDPVELLFREERCVISQREVGTDTASFDHGLRHALRQSPDVILIGEVRDATTVVAALEATETGHLVMSTMHTVNAAQTIDRILGFFDTERHKQVRQRLADNLAGVLSQRLVPARDGGQVPAFELMVPSPHVRELIDEGRTGEIAKVIETVGEGGLVSFNHSLLHLVRERIVELDDALAASDRPDELLLGLRGIRGSAKRVTAVEDGTTGPNPPSESGPGSLRLA